MAPPKFMQELEAISSGSGDSSDSEKEEGADKQEATSGDADDAAVQKKQKKEVTLEDLQRAGYTSGPSVLAVRPTRDEGDAPSWNWGDGRDRSRYTEETEEDRRATHIAATEGAERAAREAQMARLEAERRRELLKTEREEAKAKTKALSFNQKEKRKRDEEKQSRGKSYVEEEKRLQRQYGVYSGFDN